MTRINTNVSSLVAQNTLGRSNSALNQALTRLSTGLRINTGKDDPAGLIASENLRSDITSIKKAITNTDRANQVIATADSALGQVSSLLNDIRGLVTEAANTGALSDDQIAANQLQIDSSLEALNRIAQTTTFQGRRLLDGSLDFITEAGTGYNTVTDLKIDQANLGSAGSMAVNVDVSQAAQQAFVRNTSVADAVTGAVATDTLEFVDSSTGTITLDLAAAQSSGTLTFDTTAATTFDIATLAGGRAAGSVGAANGGVDISIIQDAGTAGGVDSATYDATTNTITVLADLASGTVTSTEIATAVAGINGGLDFATSNITGTNLAAGDAGLYANVATGGQDAETATIDLRGVPGTAGNISLSFTEGNAAGGANGVDVNFVSGTNYQVILSNSAPVTLANIASEIVAQVNAITAGTLASATTTSTGSYHSGTDAPPSATFVSGGAAAGAGDVITVSSETESSTPNGVTVTLVETAGIGANPVASIVSGNIQVAVDSTASTSLSAIVTAINNLEGYSAVLTSDDGDGTYSPTAEAPPTAATLAGGVTPSGGLDSDIVFEIAGANGAEVLSFQALTSRAQIVSAINSVSDATGVSAVDSGGTLLFTSSEYGSDAFVSVKILSGDDDDTFAGGLSATRSNGSDIVASVNGILASGDGNSLAINTATLDLKLTVADGSNTDVNFTITGGGGLFQLGPDVVTNQQARIGISSVNTATLGGSNGKLFQLGSGGTADLNSDTTTGFRIVEEAINQITSLRGRLGAFQRTSLETNKQALSDTLTNLTEAESQIRDADFAEETAALTRAQILVQSGTVVLQIANQNPQNVLSLLGG
ncbi:MAG: flagellin [Pirellulales bacterium]